MPYPGTGRNPSTLTGSVPAPTCPLPCRDLHDGRHGPPARRRPATWPSRRWAEAALAAGRPPPSAPCREACRAWSSAGPCAQTSRRSELPARRKPLRRCSPGRPVLRAPGSRSDRQMPGTVPPRPPHALPARCISPASRSGARPCHPPAPSRRSTLTIRRRNPACRTPTDWTARRRPPQSSCGLSRPSRHRAAERGQFRRAVGDPRRATTPGARCWDAMPSCT
mmetsp:Transcript_130920/g.407138  ORF Transcript_130920/g.407138 Transcript_130920/m.407138 type:complete len:223 (+) Transcript_130920:915-1583(+)